jgi:thiosulfate/3-mercaptopyruvate sulfurtransferase
MRIRRTDQIVLYDCTGIISVARAAWIFRYFGAENVRVLNGGMKKWLAESRKTFSGPFVAGEGLSPDGDFKYRIVNEDLAITDVATVHTLAHKICQKKSDTQIVDARPPSMFNEDVLMPDMSIRKSCITGSSNLFFG